MVNCAISLIIPYYNTPQVYFDICIDSILNQTFKNFEIIIIDDGSTEQYRSYLDGYIKNKDNRIIIYHIDNQGVSEARNYGLRKASGITVCFVDSDDYVSPWMLEDLWEAYRFNDVDAAVSRYMLTQGNDLIFRRNNNVKIVNSKEMLKTALVGMNCTPTINGYLSAGPVATLYTRNIAKSIQFPRKIKYMEDVIWNYMFFSRASNTAVVDECVYAYRQNDKSATHTYHMEMIGERVKALKVLGTMNPLKEWYALRVLANYSICNKCIVRTSDIVSNKMRRKALKKLEKISIWDFFKEKGVDAKWNRKYRLKRQLALKGLLPLIYRFKEF